VPAKTTAGSAFLDWSLRKAKLKELWTREQRGNLDAAGRWKKAGGVTSDKQPDRIRKLKDH
jgi:hypothetical protein